MIRPFRVLLVEDNPADAKLTTKVLSRCERLEASSIHLARDGEEALALLRAADGCPEELPDLILLDLNIPRVDGLGVLEAVRADERLKGIPVIVLSSSTAPQDVGRAFALHANAYVRKPVDLIGLQALVGALDRFWFQTCRYPGVQA